MQYKISKIVAGVLAIALLAVSAQIVVAATFPLKENATDKNGGTRYDNTSILNNAYIVQANLWNPPVIGTMDITGSATSATWTVTNYTANSYFPNGNELGCTLGADANDPGCNWAGTGGFYENPLPPYDISSNPPTAFVNRQIHAPAAYPDVYIGCHWGNCTANTGKPFPVQVQAVASLQSNWQINVPGGQNPTAPTNGVWDAAYDIWMDTNARGCLTTSDPTSCLKYNASDTVSINGQNDGAEIMIWVNNSGYDGGNPASATTPIQPAGDKLVDNLGNAITVNIGGKTWDIWVARVHSFDNNIAWNVISYVLPSNKYSGSTAFNLDTAPFIRDAMTRQCTPKADDLRFPADQRGVAVSCAEPSWWLTSIQAGFEIWNLPNATTNMESTNFSVTPVVLTGPNTGNRSLDDGTPLVHWDDLYKITVTGCKNAGTAQYSITAQDQGGNTVTSNTTLTETPANSGIYEGTQNPQLHMLGNGGLHGPATTKVIMNCNGTQLETDGSVYIDPSGTVKDTAGNYVVGASVTLLHSNTANGTYLPLVAGDPLMDPSVNPLQTNKYGFYQWLVQPGYYKVHVDKAGCTSADSGVLHVVDFPITDVNVVIDCGGGPGLPVVLTKTTDWTSGYCATVKVTNNTANPVDWNVNFSLAQFNGGTIYTFWNAVYTQNGNKITNVHANPANPWNKTLKPGESTHDIGFCANR
jgi:hypothetical protein